MPCTKQLGAGVPRTNARPSSNCCATRFAADPFPLSPRIRCLRQILEKLETSAPAVEPFPAPKPPAEPHPRAATAAMSPSPVIGQIRCADLVQLAKHEVSKCSSTCF
jgi:hypothetical protein